MPNTMTLINAVTLSSGDAANIQFTSIPSTYTDLVVKASLRGASNGGGTNQAWDNVKITFNGSSTGYAYRALAQIDTAASSFGNASDVAGYSWIPFAGATANTFSNTEYYIPNYTGSSNKTISTDGVMENNSTALVNALVVNSWNNSSAITSIQLAATTGNLKQYSTAYLYGIVKS